MKQNKLDRAELVARGPDIISHLPYREYDTSWVNEDDITGAILVDGETMLYWLPDGVEDIKKNTRVPK